MKFLFNASKKGSNTLSSGSPLYVVFNENMPPLEPSWFTFISQNETIIYKTSEARAKFTHRSEIAY